MPSLDLLGRLYAFVAGEALTVALCPSRCRSALYGGVSWCRGVCVGGDGCGPGSGSCPVSALYPGPPAAVYTRKAAGAKAAGTLSSSRGGQHTAAP